MIYNWNEKSLECLRNNFEQMIISDRVIIELIHTASIFNDEDYCSVYNANLPVFIDIFGDEWLLNEWEKINDADDSLTIQQIAASVRASLVEFLKDEIPNFPPDNFYDR